MDHAVALVEAYLQINGYFTVAEYPVIESFGKKHYSVATDLDILAFRLLGAGQLVSGHGGKGMFAPDPAPGIHCDTADMLIGEVKDGHEELNRNACNPEVLRTVLARFGCCPLKGVYKTVQQLINKSESVTHSEHRIRLIAFGSSREHLQRGRYHTLNAGACTDFIGDYLKEHWEVLRNAQFKHPALGLLMVLEKARREAGRSNTS